MDDGLLNRGYDLYMPFTDEKWYYLSNWVRGQTSLIQNLAIGRERTRSHGWIAHINSRYYYVFGYDGAGPDHNVIADSNR